MSLAKHAGWPCFFQLWVRGPGKVSLGRTVPRAEHCSPQVSSAHYPSGTVQAPDTVALLYRTLHVTGHCVLPLSVPGATEERLGIKSPP